MTMLAVSDVLPHRSPMLLLDRFVDASPGASLTATWTVDPTAPWFTADDTAALPSTLLLESWCQAAAALAAWEEPNPDVLTGSVMLFGSVRGVGFGSAVRPGDTLEHRVGVDRALEDTVLVSGNSIAAQREVLTVGQVVIALRPAQTLRRD